MYLVRTSAGITSEYFFSTQSKLFFEKPEIFGRPLRKLLYPKFARAFERIFGDAFDDTVYLVRSSHGIIRISCLRSIFPYSLQAGACCTRFFLLSLSIRRMRFSFLLSSERKRKEMKNYIKSNFNKKI